MTPFWPVAAHADSNEKVVTEPQSDSLVSVSNEGNCDKLSVRVEIDWNRDENAQSFVSRYAHGTESKVNDNSRWQPMPANNTLSRTDMAVGR